MSINKARLGERIREARRSKGMTQEVLSELVEVTPFYMGELERGVKTPSLDVFVRLLEALDVSADTLLRDSVAPVEGDRVLASRLSHLSPTQRAAVYALVEAYMAHM